MYVSLFLIIGAFALPSIAAEIKIDKGIYKPLFREPGEGDTVIGPLWVDETPVTNLEYSRFVKTHPHFSKSKIASLYTDKGYLNHWKGDSFAVGQEQFPVTNVSWFAARKYCESQGKRLPTIAEWEYASDAQNPSNEAQILKWYGQPGFKLREVGSGARSKFGLKDAHGLVWEWVDNFSEAIMSGDSRGGSSTESFFCGGAALKAKDPTKYATFMRFAFRSSLSAKYTSKNLGFRCAKDLTKGVSP